MRSGNYKQSKLSLFDGEGYCCIGVACITAGYTVDDLKSNNDNYAGSIVFDDGYTNHKYQLKKDLINIPKELKGRAIYNNLVKKLIIMNDGDEDDSDSISLSFEQIADWIERNCQFY